MKEYTMKEILELLIEEGIGSHEKQLAQVNKTGKLANYGQVKALKKTLLQIFTECEIIKGTGKSAVIKVGKRHPELQTREDLRSTNSGYRHEGHHCKISDRHLYDEEYYETIRSFYGSERLLQTMVDAWHEGIESAQLYRREYLARKKGFYAPKKKTGQYFIYRFISDGEIKYVGLTTALFSRMAQHFTRGHLDKEMYDNIEKIEYIEVESEAGMNLLEVYLINKWKPEWNTMRKYDGELSFDCIDNLIKEELWREYSYEE